MVIEGLEQRFLPFHHRFVHSFFILSEVFVLSLLLLFLRSSFPLRTLCSILSSIFQTLLPIVFGSLPGIAERISILYRFIVLPCFILCGLLECVPAPGWLVAFLCFF